MSEEQKRFQKAVEDILEAVMFENWLRFYFIMEEDAESLPEGKEPLLCLVVPDKGMEKIQAGWPHLYPMAEALNGRELTFETSQKAVCTFVVEHLDGHVMPRDTAQGILASATFQTRIQLFNAWVQSHEELLEQTFMEFGTWKELFDRWCADPVAKELAGKLAAASMSSSPKAQSRPSGK
jgi:hypothetical protein